jgi:rubrerythrin
MDSSKVGEKYMPVRIDDFLAELEANKSPAAATLKAQIEKLKLNGATTIQADPQDIIAALTDVDTVVKFYEDSGELNQNTLLQTLAMTNPTHRDGRLKLDQLKNLYNLSQDKSKKNNLAGISRSSFLTMNLNQLQTSFQILDNLPAGKTLNQTALDIITQSNASVKGKLTEEEQTNLSNTINTMLSSNIPLASNIPFASRFFKPNIQRFLDLDKKDWQGTQAILSNLADHRALDSRTFNYIMDNAEHLAAHATELNQLFDHMAALEIPIKGNRQFIMNIDSDFVGLNKLLTELEKKEVKLNEDSFKLLCENASDIKASQVDALSDCMKLMQQNNIPLIEDGEDKFTQLLHLDDHQLTAVKQLFESLSKADQNKEGNLDARTFDYITKNAGNLEPMASSVARVFTAMGKAGIPIIKNRQPVMGMAIQAAAATDPAKKEALEKALKNLAAVLNQIQPVDGKSLDRDAFDVLRKNISSEDYTPEEAKALGACINLMIKVGIPLTQTFGQDRLKTLLEKKNKWGDLIFVLQDFPEKKLDEQSFTALLDNIQNFNNNHLQALKSCITALANNNIPLTQMIGKDKLAKLLNLGSNLPQVAQVLAHFEKAKEGELDESTFDYLVDNADKLNLGDTETLDNTTTAVTKAELISFVFKKMKDLDISTVGHRKPIINLSAKHLKNLYAVLNQLKPEEMSEDKAFLKDFFKELRDPKNLDKFDAANTEYLGHCIAAMARNNIPLTQTIGQNKLSMLLTLDSKMLPHVATVLAAFGKDELDKDTFDFLVKNAGTLSLDDEIEAETGKDLKNPAINKITKAVLLQLIFSEMRHRDISIADNSQALMKMDINQLNSLHNVLRKLDGHLDPDSFKVLQSNLGNFNADNTASLSTCISAMAANTIPLTQMIGKDKLALLLNLDEVDLSNVAKVLESFQEGGLDEKTFNYIVKNAKSLAEKIDNSELTKADLIVNAFTAMREHGIPIVGNRQPVMNLKLTQLNTLQSVLDNLYEADKEGKINKTSPLKLDPSSFKVLLNNISQFTPKNSSALNSIIQTLTQNGISLAKTIGDDRLKSLLKADNLDDIARLFKAFEKDDKLDNRTVDYIIDNAGKFGKEKVDAIINVFDAMRAHDVKLPGNRQPIMNLNTRQLVALSNFLGNLIDNKGKAIPLSKDDFKVILNNIDKFKDINLGPLNNCIKAIKNSNIPLTQLIGPNKIERLMKLNDNLLATVDKLLTSLESCNALDSRTFDFIVDNADQLKDKAEILDTIFKTMAANNKPIIGNRQPLMKLTLQQLESFNDFLLKNLDMINSNTIGGVINKAQKGQLPVPKPTSSNKDDPGMSPIEKDDQEERFTGTNFT